MTEAAYPPEPWHLGGRATVSVFAVPVDGLPSELMAHVPAGVRVVRARGRALVAAGFAAYDAGGALAYRELAVGLLVRRSAAPLGTVPAIWVDSTSSRAAARALWSIPKELAEIDVGREATSETWRARDGRGPIAALVFRPGVRLPGVHRLPTVTLAQRLDGVERTVQAHMLARVSLGRAAWSVDPGGPLGFLHGRRPLLAVGLTQLALTFSSVPADRRGFPG